MAFESSNSLSICVKYFGYHCSRHLKFIETVPIDKCFSKVVLRSAVSYNLKELSPYK